MIDNRIISLTISDNVLRCRFFIYKAESGNSPTPLPAHKQRFEKRSDTYSKKIARPSTS